jgi:DNA-binding winged helix-turn-helix (wHTH) protein
MDAPVGGERLVFGDFCLESRSGRLFRRNAGGTWTPVPIGSRSAEILRILIGNPGVVVSRDAIMDAVWPDIEVDPSRRTVWRLS